MNRSNPLVDVGISERSGFYVTDLPHLRAHGFLYSPLKGYQRRVKRAFDVLVSPILLVLLLPLMALIALLVKLDSPGPAIFRQARVGEGGRIFTLYKFRSMAARAEEQVAGWDSAASPIHKTSDDARTTRVGRFLRRSSLDELPQLVNVLRGDMTLVGPRPELPWLVAQYEPWQFERLTVPQGITGWWQVNGRSDHPMHLHTEDDLYYVRHYSLLLDIAIVCKTPWAVIRGRGAY